MRDRHMAQCEPCIQIKKKRKEKDKKKKKKSKGIKGADRQCMRERRREMEKKEKKRFLLISKIYGNRAIGFCRSKR